MSDGEVGPIPINEDSNSLEISEKPIIDTGQITTSPSLEDEAVQENGIHVDGREEKELDKNEGEDSEDDQDYTNDADNADDDMDEDELTDDSSKQNTEEEDSQEAMQNQAIESNYTETALLISPALKTVNGKVDMLSEKGTVASQEKEIHTPREIVASGAFDTKSIGAYKSEEHMVVSSSKVDAEESMPLKSIGTPVITSPLKLVNPSEAKQAFEDKMAAGITSVGAALNITKKHEESVEQMVRPLDKLPGKNSLSFPSSDMPMTHSKLSVKPIDQLAANLVRIQSEKLDKPSGMKSLEKIAENLARSGSIVGSVVNGDDDRLPQDFCARSQAEKASALRGHRGMDLSTSPRGWEVANEQNRPMDFSGIDLSSRKFNKSIDLPSPGYRAQDFQHREMDLSTKKLNKPEVANLQYDARAVMMRNHAMVADLSKRQMSFTAYDMPSGPYHNAARIPSKEDHRLPNYTILPDPSKIAALRMNTTPAKRPLEGDDLQQDMLKRIRADVIPIRGSMEKRPMIGSNWRDEVGEAIEEPMMTIQGEGSGSDCDAVNPVLGEAVEEPIIFFYGEGSGEECQTGNPGDEAAGNKESTESNSEADSATSSLSASKTLAEDSLTNEVSAGPLVANKGSIKLNRNYPQSSDSVKGNCQVGSTQEKPKFKPTLGVQIIPKNSSSSVKRLSRWDVGKPGEKTECDSSIISNERDISPKKSETDCEDSASESQDVKVDGNSVSIEDAASQKRGVDLEDPQEDPGESSAEQKQSTTVQDSVQCDSSISLCQADTSEAVESCTETAPRKDAMENICHSDSIASHETDAKENADNECNPMAASPPRFFFGPNCISYTSRSGIFESQSDHVVSTTIQSKSDTLQYECVSSSKPVDDMIASYKSEDFDVTQTNNNSLKVKSYTSESDNSPCENDSASKVETVEGPTNTWEQTASSKYSVEQNRAVPKVEASLSNSQPTLTVEENFKPCTTDTVQDPISSSETATNEYLKSEGAKTLGSIPQPHSTNDLRKDALDTKAENTVAAPSVTQLNLTVESTEHETLEQGCSKFERQLQNEKTDLESSAAKAVTIPISSSEDEADCKSFDAPVLNESELKTDSGSVNNSCSSSLVRCSQLEAERESDSSESNHANGAELSTYQEVDSSAGKEAENVSEKESDSSTENCSKQNEKSDSFSGFDSQEEQSIDTDNEKSENQVGSDTDSAYVNCDKDKIDTLMDGTQDEVSGNSEETKEETVVDSVIKNSVPDVNTELDFAENFAVTSSESTEQCNKDALVPTISSSDDGCIRDTSPREGVKVQADSEKSSFKDECPIYNVLPEIVPDTNNFKPSKSDAVEITNEMDLSNLVQPGDEIEGAASKDQCSSVDEESNENTAASERSVESEESTKLHEEDSSSDNVSQDKDADGTSLESGASSVEGNKDDALHVPGAEETENFVNIQQDSPNNTVERTASEQDSTGCNDVRDCVEESGKENQGQDSTNNTVKSANNPEEGNNITEEPCAEDGKFNEVNADPVNPQESASEVKQSLVANYDSGDSNDGSDDVFEPVATESSETKSNLLGNLEETTVSNEQNEKESVEESTANSDVLANEIQSAFVNDQQTGSPIESNIEETEEVERKVKQISNEETVGKEYNCNVFQYGTNDKSVTSVDESRIADSPTETGIAELAKTEAPPVLCESDSGNLCNQVSRECVNSALTKTNNLMDTVKAEDESKSSVSVTEKLANLVQEQIDDSKSECSEKKIGILEGTKAGIEPNDTNNEVTRENSTEQHVKSIEEKLATNFDNDIKFNNTKAMEHVGEELPLVEPYKKLKELSQFGDKENKFDMNLQEESHVNKELPEEVDAPVHSVPNLLPLKFDNISSGVNKSEICKNNISAISEDFKPIDNWQFVNFMSEKPENLDVMENHEKRNESLSVINKMIETLPESIVPNANDSAAIFSEQVAAPESAVVKNDSKKEASKRLSDVSDIQDVPPLKSKPPYVESNEQVLENLTSSEVQLDKSLDSFKQVTVPVEGTKIIGDVVSDTGVGQLTKDEFSTVSNEADTLKEAQQNSDADNEEEKESSEIQSVDIKEISLTSDDSMGVDNENIFNTAPEEVDPLACTDEDTLRKLGEEQTDTCAPKIGIRVKPVSELVYEGWKLDSTESPKVSRKRRNSSHDSNSDDGGTKQEEDEMMGGKRIRLRGKRLSDKQLRKSIEESRVVTISSEDEAVKCSPEKSDELEIKDVSDDQSTPHLVAIERKARGRPRGRRRRGYRGNARAIRPKHSEFRGNKVSEISPEIRLDVTQTNNDALSMTPISQKKRKKSEYLRCISMISSVLIRAYCDLLYAKILFIGKMVLGLEVGRDIAEVQSGMALDETPVRQSRRIAQQKIKEEADKRRIEEEAVVERKDKKDSTEKKKRKKIKVHFYCV